ncbi:MAG: TrbC/VirB2 family protein [Pseudomonadota bacterium]|nr:TrbC/VirB2 family protein [Gammaproteobacteria bacterium]MBU1629056.1 TrbC/VirB2 family protein [Gammaproteobacteria bacterium]MBU1927074.1 TrbC/VirB2 family protein [Gammaproteobacteria bacterium]MBU2546530.1 TrbC/VirB2 family protein [Gammaproteobacteria bacterium]
MRFFRISSTRLQTYLALLFLSPSVAWADGSTAIDQVLSKFLDYLTSTPARILATLAIVGVGYATWHLGKVPKDKAMAVIIGIGIVFGGASILQMLGVGA